MGINACKSLTFCYQKDATTSHSSSHQRCSVWPQRGPPLSCAVFQKCIWWVPILCRPQLVHTVPPGANAHWLHPAQDLTTPPANQLLWPSEENTRWLLIINDGRMNLLDRRSTAVLCVCVCTSLCRGCRGCRPGPAESDILSAASPMLQSLCCPESREAGADRQCCGTAGEIHSSVIMKSREKSRRLPEASAALTLWIFTCEPCWGWGTSSRLRALRCLLFTWVTGRYMEYAIKHTHTHTLFKKMFPR